jgi:hypothetical protein
VGFQRPAVGEVERDAQQHHRADDAHAQRIVPRENLRNDVADDDVQTERHADERTDALPLADDHDGDSKDDASHRIGVVRT